MSAFIGSTHGQLFREGAFVWQQAKATGFWSYNGRISYWAISPEPALEERLTWTEFAKAEGLDPLKWDLVDQRSNL